MKVTIHDMPPVSPSGWHRNFLKQGWTPTNDIESVVVQIRAQMVVGKARIDFDASTSVTQVSQLDGIRPSDKSFRIFYSTSRSSSSSLRCLLVLVQRKVQPLRRTPRCRHNAQRGCSPRRTVRAGRRNNASTAVRCTWGDIKACSRHHCHRRPLSCCFEPMSGGIEDQCSIVCTAVPK